MSHLTLVRHGQAAAFEQAAGQLSDLGEAQAVALARFWLKNRVSFDEVFTGTLARQTSTERIVAQCYSEAQAPWPAPQVMHGFDEYDALGVLNRLVPFLASRDERFADLVRAFEATRLSPERNRTFQRMFEVAMKEWQSGGDSVDGFEPWPVFRERMRDALRHVRQGAANRRVAVFTSGGPIGLAVQLAMHAPDAVFLEVNWRIRNCSITEFVFSGERFTLDSFNGVPHLEDTSLWSYR